MSSTVIISRDPSIRERLLGLPGGDSVRWIDSCDGLETALSVPMERVIVDLNVQWEADITQCIRRCKEEGGASDVVAFLHERTGDIAIRAHLAGADRVIPQNQLEKELGELI